MNNLVSSNIKKYLNKSSNNIFDVIIKTKYTKENLVKNKKGRQQLICLLMK